jgi:hypothetical protein
MPETKLALPMLASVSRTRAAVLCFGGWGLQTMLHLWPRLCLIQEEREVLGIDRELPNLDRLTAFAAILPEAAPTPALATERPGSCGPERAPGSRDSAGASVPVSPFHVLQPNLALYPAPSYLKRQLASIEVEVAEAPVAGLTHAERIGSRLLKRAQDDGYIRPLPVTFPPSEEDLRQPTPAKPSGRAFISRRETFRAAIDAAGPIVRALLSQVIDPTRLDSMQTRDPFVQTTIYVIAPLSEPRASALVWPVVSELVGALRRRHVARVIAFFSTASFAPDDGRGIEEATAHMSRREMETLTDSGSRDDSSEVLSRLIPDHGGVAWQERVGRRLFDMIYLIDREKSNQALAESSHELSVLAGNAIEAFLVADGLGHLEKSLGPDTVTEGPSYSVLGTASDHVPLAECIASAIEDEQKRVIGSAVLAVAGPPVSLEPDLASPAKPAGLRDEGLRQMPGASPDALIRLFLEASGTPMFELAANQPSAGWPPELRVTEGYILPKAVANDLRKTRDPLHWRELLERRATEAAVDVNAVYGRAQVAWGLLSEKPEGSARDLPPALGRASSTFQGDIEPAYAAAGRSGAGLIPKAVDLATEQVVADICSAPDGILRARARLSGWLAATGSLLRDLQSSPVAASGLREEDHRWETGAGNDGNSYQSRLDAWRWEYTSVAASSQQTIALWVRILGLACLGSFVLAAAILLQRTFELGREGRIALVVGIAVVLASVAIAAWFAITGRIRRLKRQGVKLVQEGLSQEASRMLCRGLSRAYLQLYEELNRLQAAVEGTFRELSDWTRAEPAPQRARVAADEFPMRAKLTDEGLREIVRGHIRRESANGELSRKRFDELWRAAGSASPEWLPQGSVLARRLRAALDGSRQAHASTHSIADVFRGYAAQATDYLSPTHRLFADHPTLMKEVIGRYGVERLLLLDQRHESVGAGDQSGAGVVEDICARAKPSAGFEVTYLLSSDVLEIEFGMTAEGPASPLSRAFEQRGMPLLTSKDPLTLSVVRTVNRLNPSELILTERCRDEYVRLTRNQREMLSLLAPDERSEEAILYMGRNEPMRLELPTSPAAAR